MEKLLRKGAEADIYVGDWYGDEVIRKIRKPKTFMHPKLDAELRRHRTVIEALSLSQAKDAGVSTPYLYYVDPGRGEIIMEYVHGERFKDLLARQPLGKLIPLCVELGRCVARLHAANLMHGDLSTSNFLVTGDSLTFIDFGLSFISPKLEDRAVDLHLVKEVLRSAHGNVWEEVFRFILKGYEEVSGEKQVAALTAKIREIERRGRYARVE